MNNFLQMLANGVNNLRNNAQSTSFFNRLSSQTPTVQATQYDNDGNIDYDATLRTRQATTPTTFSEKLFGRDMTMDEQKINPEGETELVTHSNFKPGFFNSLNAGMEENFNNPLTVNNLRPAQKGVGYKIGEALGTVGRSLSGGLGDAWVAGYQGLDKGVARQNMRTGDELYRKQLAENYGMDEEDLKDVNGFITDTTFNNLTKSQNSAMNVAIRQQTAQSMNKLRELQAEKQRIINSNLPDMQKAKLLQENAKAAHAEEMQLAKINYYNNAVLNPLGWANFGLKQEESDRKNKESQAKIKALEELSDGGGQTEPETKPKHRTNAF